MGNLIRAITEDGSVAITAVDSTAMVAEMERIHKTSAVITAALGRLLTAASMMGAAMKGKQDSVTLRIKADGPAGVLVAVGDSNGNVKGYVGNSVVELPLNSFGKLDVKGAVGTNGLLYVVKDIGLKEPYVGQIPLRSGEIAEDIAAYYAFSEQVPTVCALGVLVAPDLSVKTAGGFFLQLLPGADESIIDRIEKNMQSLPAVTKLLEQGLTPLEIAKRALDGFSIQVLDERDAAYHCDCSRQRVERALCSLGETDMAEIAEDEQTEILCNFCGKAYHFSKQEIERLRAPQEKDASVF